MEVDGETASVSVIAVILIPAAVPVAPMFALVLARNLIIGLRMIVAKLAVKLAMLPRAQPLLVRFGVLLVEPVVDVVMFIRQLLVLMIVTAPSIMRHRRCRKTQQRDRADGSKCYLSHGILLVGGHGVLLCD